MGDSITRLRNVTPLRVMGEKSEGVEREWFMADTRLSPFEYRFP